MVHKFESESHDKKKIKSDMILIGFAGIWVTRTESRLGWFTAYLANVFLIKLQDPILPGRPRDHINPKHASES